jgi:hypothetical protein
MLIWTIQVTRVDGSVRKHTIASETDTDAIVAALRADRLLFSERYRARVQSATITGWQTFDGRAAANYPTAAAAGAILHHAS